jgi:hypothetical protein
MYASAVAACVMQVRARLIFISIVSIVWFTVACTPQASAPADPHLSIRLRWVKSYPTETRASVTTGLMWGLAYLGAAWPENARALDWDVNIVTIDLAAADVIAATRPAWRQFLGELKNSAEYRAYGAFDAGRFMALALGSSYHYYALTGARPSYREFRSQYEFEPRQAAIIESGIARGHRLIEVGRAMSHDQVAFVAFEGTGSIRDGTFSKREVETLDVMPNGQLRFALYDLDGRLKSAATAELTEAGKPAKCLWCHEIRLMQTIDHRTDVPGYYSSRDFDRIVAERRNMIDRYRDHLESAIDFRREQDHTFAELLYVSFMEPSIERVAAEWNVTVERAEEMLRHKTTHRQTEYRVLQGDRYRRRDIDEMAPLDRLRVPDDLREPSSYEPQLVQPFAQDTGDHAP